jgi:trehalose 6-phosphate synthase/phosphatase
MSKLIFISNRLPVTIHRDPETDEFELIRSIGGLATGLGSVHEGGESLWVGWSGLHAEDITEEEDAELQKKLVKEQGCLSFHLSRQEYEDFYIGFCNEAIWPLFHYFPNRARFNRHQWEAYRQINHRFFAEVRGHIEPGDTIWVHDYHLMLLPHLIKRNFPDSSLGFFLHIPFPSYEILRLLPWREEVMEGLLGADLLGFHTFDYVRHFISSARRILGCEFSLGYLTMDHRLVRPDVFPMGIDYEKYRDAEDLPEVAAALDDARRRLSDFRTILSVDRLDYSKGIPERIRGFDLFLHQHPEYHEKVSLNLIVAPSRTEVEEYQDLLREIQELVSTVNGKHGTLNWVPIHFFYRTFPFEELSALYMVAEVLLVTAIRDGMNLIAKEYLAARRDDTGVLILSETAGAVHELGESLVINPNDIEGIANAILRGLEMDPSEQKQRNAVMKQRLARYHVRFWARDFIAKLIEVRQHQEVQTRRSMIDTVKEEMLAAYRKAKRKLFFLNYDGTLVGYQDTPDKARPDQNLRKLIENLCFRKGNRVVIVSGRKREDLESFFSGLPVDLAAAHGSWLKTLGEDWEKTEFFSADWKETIRPILENYTDRTPGSFIEEKIYSLAWHYRKCEPDLAALRIGELKDSLFSVTENLNVGIIDGNKVLEVKDTAVHKGRAVSKWLKEENSEFIFAAGDDPTDEDLFDVLPESAYSVKVGMNRSRARYHIKDWRALRKLLEEMVTA